MTGTIDGGPAFPSRTQTSLKREDGTRQTTMVEEGHLGLSMRDYFAGQALAGFLANAVTAEDMRLMRGDGDSFAKIHAKAARVMYQVADAMLEARNPATRVTPTDPLSTTSPA